MELQTPRVGAGWLFFSIGLIHVPAVFSGGYLTTTLNFAPSFPGTPGMEGTQIPSSFSTGRNSQLWSLLPRMEEIADHVYFHTEINREHTSVVESCRVSFRATSFSGFRGSIRAEVLEVTLEDQRAAMALSHGNTAQEQS